MHDIRLLRSTLRNALTRSRGIHCGVKEHLCMDKGYDSVAVRSMVEIVFDYIPYVRTRGEEKESKRNSRQRARRWVVERTHSWMNRFRAILVRWDKKLSNNIAASHLAGAYIPFKCAGFFGYALNNARFVVLDTKTFDKAKVAYSKTKNRDRCRFWNFGGNRTKA